MDVFKLKWNERMQHDPYVNFVLNSDERFIEGEPFRIEYYGLFSKNKPRIMTPWIEKIDGQYYKKHRRIWNDKNVKFVKKKVKDYPPAAQKIDYERTDPIHTPGQLHDNTRPQSLYKLRYASLR